MRPFSKVPFSPISASDKIFNPRNTTRMPPVKNLIFLELDRLLRNDIISSSSRRKEILTTGIHEVFRGSKFFFNAEIGEISHSVTACRQAVTE